MPRVSSTAPVRDAVIPESGPAVVSDDATVTALARFLRALAAQVERDTALRVEFLTLLHESGLMQASHASQPQPASETPVAPRAAKPLPALDPFAALRQGGVDGLREALASLDLAALRTVVRAHRLDPARISARWTAPERVIDLIIEQVQARTQLGRAFERV
jgi:hypothetical protein